jgi:hypothetical protein
LIEPLESNGDEACGRRKETCMVRGIERLIWLQTMSKAGIRIAYVRIVASVLVVESSGGRIKSKFTRLRGQHKLRKQKQREDDPKHLTAFTHGHNLLFNSRTRKGNPAATYRAPDVAKWSSADSS